MSKQAPNPSRLAELISQHRTGDEPTAAPQWDFDPKNCGEFQIRIDRDGAWYYQDSPIRRKSLCKLFSSVLRRDDAGNFYLVTPVEQGRIEVEDAPFTAVEVIADGVGADRTITFRSNLDHMVMADRAHPIRVVEDAVSGEPAPYVLVRDGLEALILRPQFYELVEMAEERVEDGVIVFGVWSAGAFFRLGSAPQECCA